VLKKQVINFILVGMLNTIFGYALYVLFIFIGMHYILAIFLATIIGVLFNFKTISHFVFKTHNNSLIFRFIGVYVIVFLINILIITIFKSMDMNDYIAGLLAVVPCAILSFVLNKVFVYKK